MNRANSCTRASSYIFSFLETSKRPLKEGKIPKRCKNLFYERTHVHKKAKYVLLLENSLNFKTSNNIICLGFFSRCLLREEEERGRSEAEPLVDIVRNGSWEGII